MLKYLSLISPLIVLFFFQNGFAQEKKTFSHATSKIIKFNPEESSYQEILDGEQDSAVFYSGVVTLDPESSGELHSTKTYEELIIVLNGQGLVKIINDKSLELRYGNIAFIPPNSEHQVFNTGPEKLKYIYVATKSKFDK